MSFGSHWLEVLGLVLSVLFSVWPLLLLIPIPLGSNNNGRRMLRVWMTVAFLRILLLWGPIPYTSFEPEPIYSLLFIMAGCMLVGLGLVRRIRTQRQQRSGSEFSPGEHISRAS